MRGPDGIWTTALRDLAGRSNHWASEDYMMKKGEMWVWLELHRAVTQPNNDFTDIWNSNCFAQSS